ncbi:unnamed protein product [Miscanthus lutarioriparius]|uniref:cellulase n=1 Tax=Miscanthus lutarioriparius TaxID=422564 RepID=A0A811R663_9POAL|nr:unnamed protein product [Miscanthus lutarioriparius]
MRSSIATYRESLSRLAGEVDDAAADEVPAPPLAPAARGGDLSSTPPSSGRRRRYSRPGPGSEAAEPDEISKLRDDIQKLQASEAEIKALSFNYAAMLKEKEEQLGKLREENGSLKRSLESCKAVSANSNGTLERSPRTQRNAVQENSLNLTKQNGYGGGSSHGTQANGLHPVTGYQKGSALEEERSSLITKQASLENEIKQLKQQLSNNSEKETETKRRLEDETKRNEFLQQQLNELKMNKERISTSMEGLHKELSEKKSELRRVQDDLSRRDKEHIEKVKLEADLKSMKSTSQKTVDSTFDTNKISDSEKVKEEMDSLKRALQDASRERDKAVQDLARLKQHLLDKDLEDQEKMDEDSKLIEELRVVCEQQRAHIMQLERALKTALGQYYAESEAKERLGGDLAVAREELSKLSESLKVANQTIEISRREKEDIATKLSQAERMLVDGKRSMQKFEDDNSRLRRALEQSMTTVNRMSLDSDNSVDRRIVIKLLVTYFQREITAKRCVLDLMVRMLGFSEEDKQRIGFAQNNAGKGVVRGVLGLPGRLVGGIVGGGTSGKSTQASQDSQSFADLWVDFLLKETEEREKREASEVARQSQEESHTATGPISACWAGYLSSYTHVCLHGLETLSTVIMGCTRTWPPTSGLRFLLLHFTRTRASCSDARATSASRTRATIALDCVISGGHVAIPFDCTVLRGRTPEQLVTHDRAVALVREFADKGKEAPVAEAARAPQQRRGPFMPFYHWAGRPICIMKGHGGSDDEKFPHYICDFVFHRKFMVYDICFFVFLVDVEVEAEAQPFFSVNLVSLLFDFANNYRGSYQLSCSFYCSYSGYQDELQWASAWLYRATKDSKYLDFLQNNQGGSATEFSWDNKYPGAQLLATQEYLGGRTELEGYKRGLDSFVCAVMPNRGNTQIRTTPGGLLFTRDSVNLQYTTTAALLLSIYSKTLTSVGDQVVQCSAASFSPDQISSFATSQVDNILGDNPKGMSYMVGFSSKFPRHIHHRGSSIPSIKALPRKVTCNEGFSSWFPTSNPNPNTHVGAIVGGTDGNDHFSDSREDSTHPEPATYINAAFVGACAAALGQNQHKEPLDNIASALSDII